VVPKVQASITVKGRAVEAERVWYDKSRWASWVDGFGHLVTLEVEDAKLEGTQRVEFEPGPESVKVTLSLEYRLKERTPVTPVVDLLFIRRALGDSLRRTLRRFSLELAAERQFGPAR